MHLIRRLSCLAILAVILLGLAPWSSQAADEVTKVTVTFCGDSSSAKGFTWYTDLTSTQSDVQIVLRTGNSPDFSKAVTYTGTAVAAGEPSAEMLHKVTVTGLKQNAVYDYRVGDSSLDLWSEPGILKTAITKGPFTFIDLSDTQAGPRSEAELSASTIRAAYATFPEASFFILNGDIVDSGKREEQWDAILGSAKSTLMNTTIVPAAGNHDSAPGSFIRHFQLDTPPGSGTTTGAYYSFDYANAHFITLNTNETSEEYADFSPTQIDWLKSDVEKARARGAEWFIVTLHKGPYTTSGHATDRDITGWNGVRTKTALIFSDLRIDLVLQGHDHIYARSKPIRDGLAVIPETITETTRGQLVEYAINPNGPIYLIPNTAGPKVYQRNADITDEYLDLFAIADEHHAAYIDDSGRPKLARARIQNFVGITIDNDRLTALVYEIDRRGESATPYIIDRFGILKKKH